MLAPCLTLLIGWELLNIFLGVVFKSVVPFMYHVGCTPSFLLAIFLVLHIYIYIYMERERLWELLSVLGVVYFFRK